ncbi:MAG: 1-acyl-sn-glycerol-3-phosphate acyltransferase [Rickettsiales bacterium]|nr:1-acyl-sn-glycerol-3-phosphate acyltransferase [Rickettsiales bacterium]
MWVWTALFGVFSPLAFIHPKIARALSTIWVDGVLLGCRIICGLKCEVRGREHMPEGSAIFASKHQSSYDTFILWKLLRGPVFILKKELLRIPIYGWYLAMSELIAIDRKAGAKMLPLVVEQAKKRVINGRKLVIFPEGTRRKPGEPPKYRMGGLKALYAALNIPIVPVALNTGVFWPKGQFSKPSGTIIIEFLPAIEAGLESGEMEKQVEAAIEGASNALPHTP